MVQGRELVESGEVLDPASKLEQDYIQMFLGKLEPMQVKDVTLKKTTIHINATNFIRLEAKKK